MWIVIPYSERTQLRPVDHTPLQEVCHGVVGHIYGGI